MAYAVLTRDEDGCAAYRAALAALGLDVVALPVTRSDHLAELELTGDHAAIVVASANAAAAVARAAAHRELPPIFAVGDATARALPGAQVPAGVVDGASLARAIAPTLRGKRVLLPRAEQARPELVEILEASGVIVDAQVVYRTVPAAFDPAPLAGAAVIIVFAPSQVAALGEHALTPAPFVAIGQTTAAALHSAGAKTIAVADAPTPEGIARALATVYPPRTRTSP